LSGTVNVDALIDVQDSSTVDFTRSGAGTILDPFVLTAQIDVTPVLEFVDSVDVDWTLIGDGTADVPLTVTADLPWLGDLAPAAVGFVLAKQPDGTWTGSPPVTAPVGAINTGHGISGDGSTGDPLRVNVCSYDDLRLGCAPP
ncbi:MAG TPA: hypothetical protein VIX41_06445, partial [Acidimicrobiales bacterium]